MNAVCPYAALLLVLYCLPTLATDGDFYRLFQSAVTNYYSPSQRAATNEQLIEITSPLLVDTNNTGFKPTNALVHLEALKGNGEPSGLRLGMRMEDVVAKWGKPLWIDPQCGGCPHFGYSQAHVYFEPASNSVRAIHADVFELARTLGMRPTTEDCVRKVGRPNRRRYYAEGTHCYLVYEKPEGTLGLLCVSGELTSIEWGRDLKK